MLVGVTTIVDHEVKYLKVNAKVRYWEDDEDDVPFREGDYWCPVIDLDEGKIVGWPPVEFKLYLKVCDAGCYTLLGPDKMVFREFEGIYVPSVLAPMGDGYGDYISMHILPSGHINDYDQETVYDLVGYED